MTALIILIGLLFGAVITLVCGIYSFFMSDDEYQRPGPRRHKIKDSVTHIEGC